MYIYYIYMCVYIIHIIIIIIMYIYIEEQQLLNESLHFLHHDDLLAPPVLSFRFGPSRCRGAKGVGNAEGIGDAAHAQHHRQRWATKHQPQIRNWWDMGSGPVSEPDLVGGFSPPPWKIWVCQIGSSSQLLGKIRNVWNHQPADNTWIIND